jgi:hypothetical protein
MAHARASPASVKCTKRRVSTVAATRRTRCRIMMRITTRDEKFPTRRGDRDGPRKAQSLMNAELKCSNSANDSPENRDLEPLITREIPHPAGRASRIPPSGERRCAAHRTSARGSPVECGEAHAGRRRDPNSRRTTGPPVMCRAARMPSASRSVISGSSVTTSRVMMSCSLSMRPLLHVGG